MILDSDDSGSNQSQVFESVFISNQVKEKKIEDVKEPLSNLQEQKSYLLKEEVLEDSRSLIFEKLKQNKHRSWSDEDDDEGDLKTGKDDLNESKDLEPQNWSEDECILLVYIGDNLGKDWSNIQAVFKTYFKNKRPAHLSKKYRSLIEHDLIESLMEKTESIKDIDIITNLLNQARKKIRPSFWTNEQQIYLVRFIQKYGSEWELLSKNFTNKFHVDHSIAAYKRRYIYLRDQPKEFELIKKLAKKIK
jgi:hypothetical protein